MPVPQDTNNEDPPTTKIIPFGVGVEWGKLDAKRRNQAIKEKKSEPKLRNMSRVALKAKQRIIRMRLPPQLQTKYHVTVATSSSRSSNRSRGGEGVTTRDDDHAFTWTGDKRKRLAEGREADDGSDGRASKRSRNGECASSYDGTPARPQTVKRKRPAEDHGADADSDSRSSKRIRDGDRAPTRDGAHTSNTRAPIVTRSIPIATRPGPSKSVPTTHAPAARLTTARSTTARPTTLTSTTPSESVPTSRASIARPSALVRPVPSERVPTTRVTTTGAPSTRPPTYPHTTPSKSAPTTRTPIAPATHTPDPSRPASSKTVRSPDARDGVPLSNDVKKGAPSTAGATKLRSEEKECPPKEKVSSLEEEDDLMECVFEPELPLSSVNRFLRLFVKQARTDNSVKCGLMDKCWDIIDQHLDDEVVKRLRAANASKEHRDLPWPFLRRVRAKVLYKAIDKEAPLMDFEDACREDLEKLFCAVPSH